MEWSVVSLLNLQPVALQIYCWTCLVYFVLNFPVSNGDVFEHFYKAFMIKSELAPRTL